MMEFLTRNMILYQSYAFFKKLIYIDQKKKMEIKMSLSEPISPPLPQ